MKTLIDELSAAGINLSKNQRIRIGSDGKGTKVGVLNSRGRVVRWQRMGKLTKPKVCMSDTRRRLNGPESSVAGLATKKRASRRKSNS